MPPLRRYRLGTLHPSLLTPVNTRIGPMATLGRRQSLDGVPGKTIQKPPPPPSPAELRGLAVAPEPLININPDGRGEASQGYPRT